MGWIRNIYAILDGRRTQYNNSVVLTGTDINTMMGGFDSFFNSILNFTEEIASIQLYPYIIPVKEPTTPFHNLKTSRGKTAANAWEIDEQKCYINMGQFEVVPKYNNFADYNGYTKIKAYLPFVGYVDIDVNECMGKVLQFRLFVDYFSGKGMFVIGVSDSVIELTDFPVTIDDELIRVISTFECDVGIDIPLGQSNIGDIRRNILLGTVKTAASFGFSMASLSLPPSATTTTSTVTPKTTSYNVQGRGAEKGSRLKTIKSGNVTTSGGSSTTTTVHHKPVNMFNPVSDAVNSSLDVINALHAGGSTDRINDSGLNTIMSGNVQIIIYRPKFVTLDENYGALYGYPLGSTQELGDLRGYTEINAIHIEGAGFETITNKEVSLLEEVFANGIIL